MIQQYNKYTFFYRQGHPFSQWYYFYFTDEGIKFNCAEQYMMYQKAMFFDDESVAQMIMKAEDPKEQKALGRKVSGFSEVAWNAVARDIVYRGNYAKFSALKEMKEFILSTDGTLLVEASPYDKIWGIGLSETNPRRFDPANWEGTNWLGEVLTKVREDLKAGIKTTENFGWSS